MSNTRIIVSIIIILIGLSLSFDVNIYIDTVDDTLQYIILEPLDHIMKMDTITEFDTETYKTIANIKIFNLITTQVNLVREASWGIPIIIFGFLTLFNS